MAYQGNNKRFNNNYNQENNFEFEKKGFLDEKGILREALMTDEAKEIAKKLVGFNKKKPITSSSQIRAFFYEVKAIQNRIGEKENFNKEYPFILMLKSKAEYKTNGNKIPKYFKDFIVKAVDYIKNSDNKFENFNAFSIFYEVIIGYYYGIV